MENTNQFPPFAGFPKMARLSKDICVSEKLDGTNAAILITEEGGFFTASRNRWIVPGDDNAGFSKWAHENKEVLLQLGPGHHFGEWWGKGIQRGYGMDKKVFSLFNVTRWGFLNDVTPEQNPLAGVVRVVPLLYQGPFNTDKVQAHLDMLEACGSAAAPGFMDPEGVIVYHIAAGIGFKKTLKGDGGKWTEK